ncbi:carboxypeptidase-like regulatory domain-containing protein [Pedobacter sp. NJ-S-72]
MKKLLQSLFVLMLFAISAMAQQRTITGTVTGKEDGLPIPGVSVRVKGTKTGSLTGAAGKYSISVPKGSVELIFSSLGYISHTRNANSDVVNITLESDVQSLQDVVITGAYGSEQTKKTQTGSIGIVRAKDLEATPLVSIDKALQGRVAGVMSVSGNGQPGSSQDVRIRGTSSVNASNQPLYVIDGVPVNIGVLLVIRLLVIRLPDLILTILKV